MPLAVAAAAACLIFAGPGRAEQPILWKGPAMAGWRETDRLLLSGVLEGGTFKPSALAPEPPPVPAEPALVPLGGNLLALAEIRSFGVEERTEVERNGQGLRLRCRAGRAPSGVVLSWPARRFPSAYRGEWNVDGSSSAPLQLSAVSDGKDGKVQPDAVLWQGAARFPFDDPAPPSLVIACPNEGASAVLNSVALAPPAGSGPSRSRGTWVWSDAAWRGDPAGFARRAAAAGWSELAVQLPSQPDDTVRALIAALAERGIDFRFVDGDPAHATAEGLDSALPHFIRWRRWCKAHLVDLPRLELDIEPYALAGWAADPASGWAGWAKAIRTVSAIWGQPLAVDVPWWMMTARGGMQALRHAQDSIGEIVVMAYRTDPQLILDAAEPWFSVADKPIRIAIETGAVATEVTRTYRRAGRGTLLLNADGATLLANAREAGEDEVMFALTGEQLISPARVSFHGAPEEAASVERSIVPLLAGWRRFAGFRLHGWAAEGEMR